MSYYMFRCVIKPRSARSVLTVQTSNSVSIKMTYVFLRVVLYWGKVQIQIANTTLHAGATNDLIGYLFNK